MGRPRPFPWVATALLVALATAAIIPWLRRLDLERRLSAAASAMVGTAVDVNCQTFGGAFFDAGADLGYVHFGRDGSPVRSALIKREQCRALSSYLDSSKRPVRDEVVAVHVLTHETIHMSGVTNEAQAECLALQRNAEMGRLLGASPDEASDLAVTYWRRIYPHVPAEYRSQECGPGGALDAGLPDPPWAPPE